MSAFRLQIPGIDTSRVNKIEAITVTPKSVNPGMDLSRQPANSLAGKGLHPAGAPTVSSLVILIPQASVQPFQQWLATAPTSTKSASIDYLGLDMMPLWETLSLQGLSITKISTVPGPAANGIVRSRVEMTIGGIQLVSRP